MEQLDDLMGKAKHVLESQGRDAAASLQACMGTPP